MEIFNFEVYLIKSVHRDLQLSIVLGFAKNEALKELLGIPLAYNQLIMYIQEFRIQNVDMAIPNREKILKISHLSKWSNRALDREG